MLLIGSPRLLVHPHSDSNSSWLVVCGGFSDVNPRNSSFSVFSCFNSRLFVTIGAEKKWTYCTPHLLDHPPTTLLPAIGNYSDIPKGVIDGMAEHGSLPYRIPSEQTQSPL